MEPPLQSRYSMSILPTKCLLHCSSSLLPFVALSNHWSTFCHSFVFFRQKSFSVYLLLSKKKKMEPSSTWSFVFDFIYLAWCFESHSCLFLLLSCSLECEHTKIYLAIHQWMSIWIVLNFQLLWIVLLWIFVYIFTCLAIFIALG